MGGEINFTVSQVLLFSLIPSPSHPSFCLAAVEKKHETKAGVGRTGNEATYY